METSKTKQTLDKLLFKRLTRLYIAALSLIAFSIVVSHVIIDNEIDNQKQDSYLINLSGRQRMLSQKLSKEVLQIQQAKTIEIQQDRIQSLQATLQKWSTSHEILKTQHNEPKIDSLFRLIDAHYSAMYSASSELIKYKLNLHQLPPEQLSLIVSQVNRNEGLFLQLMDQIVNQYEEIATQKLTHLRFLELLIFLITIAVLILEFLFVYKPAAVYVKSVISKLLIAEKKAIKMAYDADVLCEAKDQSVKELRALNYAMDQTLLFCRITPEGEVTHIGDNFSKLLQTSSLYAPLKFSNILTYDVNERRLLEDLIRDKGKSGWQGEIKVTQEKGRLLWLDITMIPVSIQDNKSEILIICLNITDRKIAQLEVERLNQDRFYNEINQQKILSSKIVENQENEQNRIAKEIHDGIGQMLTGLKFSLESIDLEQKEKTAEKIIYLKKLAADIIKGVRTATFNLMPPELKDHGIASSLLRMTQELTKLTGKNILFINKTDFNERLDSLIEINIYRITQEAINNAIKYANSSHIVVMISHRDNILSITIDDNGDGFDPLEVEKFKSSESGMGMEFMKERIKYINGRIFLNSVKGEGTHITLNIPIGIYV